MDISLLILIAMVVAAIVFTLWKGGRGDLLSGFKEAGVTFKSIWVRLLLGFSLGGLIQVSIPSGLIADWLGPTSGLKGILIGSYTGIVITGGPYVSLPIIASIYEAGAGPGPVIALLTSMNMLSLPGLFTWAIPFLGARLALTRYVVCVFVPPLVGLAGAAVFQLFDAT